MWVFRVLLPWKLHNVHLDTGHARSHAIQRNPYEQKQAVRASVLWAAATPRPEPSSPAPPPLLTPMRTLASAARGPRCPRRCRSRRQPRPSARRRTRSRQARARASAVGGANPSSEDRTSAAKATARNPRRGETSTFLAAEVLLSERGWRRSGGGGEGADGVGLYLALPDRLGDLELLLLEPLDLLEPRALCRAARTSACRWLCRCAS